MQYLLLILLLLTTSVSARYINIPNDFDDIQDGIDEAEDGDVVFVEPGEYEDVNFNGKAITLASMFIVAENIAYIDSTQISGYVRFVNGEDEHSIFTGFTLHDLSRGVECTNASPTISHLNILSVEDREEGSGGITLINASPTISNVVIKGLRGSHVTGILCLGESSPLVSNSLICDVKAEGHIGGGIYCSDGASPVLRDVTISGNAINRGFDEIPGSGIFARESNITLISCIVRDNEAPDIYTEGGWLRFSYSDLDRSDEEMVCDSVNLAWFSIDEDPLFVDPDNGDYHLTVDSPCIDRGSPRSPEDPDGTRSDMGVYHFHQKDIEVEPLRTEFPPTPLGVLDSQSVEIRNVGGTVLTFDDIYDNMPIDPCIWIEIPEDLGWPVEIEPESAVHIWVYFQPDEPFPSYSYRCGLVSDDPDEGVVMIDVYGEVLSVNDPEIKPSFDFTITSIHPNPFNSTVNIEYSLPHSSEIELHLLDITGREVIDMTEGFKNAGVHRIVLNATDLVTGVYIVKLVTPTSIRTAKIVHVR